MDEGDGGAAADIAAHDAERAFQDHQKNIAQAARYGAARVGDLKPCAYCGKMFVKKSPAHKFCKFRCKDAHHNWKNPRGKFKHLSEFN